ncbi:MAG: MBL fold metallo-hydrolase [Tissierellia bacterium]|nr:MBL fold metallo-hydrolase [Tissierellia bacterium]
MRIRFIHHSAYVIELDRHLLVFDYFNQGNLDLAPGDKDLIFFVSHGHEDHFHPAIFAYRQRASYVLSQDVTDLDPQASITRIRPGEVKKVKDLSVHAFESTDIGVSFLIEVEGKRIYYAGDHNFWLWPHYRTQDIGEIYQQFTREVLKASERGPVDVALSLVDPRMGDYYHLTGQYCLDILEPKHFFPLHLWGDFGLSKTFAKRFQPAYPDTVIHSLERDGQTFIIEEE